MLRFDEARLRTPPITYVAIVAFSALTVYCTWVSIHSIDIDTGLVAPAESLKHYRQALAGTRPFPYQWRLLGDYIVYAIERITGGDPHAIDVIVKTVLLACSATLLLQFSRRYTTFGGALAVVGLYFLLTIAGFTDQYTIYFTNDYAMVAAWFAAVYCIRERRYGAAAALTLVGALAKETMLLAPLLVGVMWLRRRASLADVLLLSVAFVVPTVFLRWMYRAPIGEWAWWQMLFANVPFLQSSVSALLTTLKDNAKVALFYNVLWIVAARVLVRTSDTFVKDLGVTAVLYLMLAYPVIHIRELRHFLPLAILILPVAIGELERWAEAQTDAQTATLDS
jgi:hypothetical protein